MKRIISLIILFIVLSGTAQANINVIGKASVLVVPDQVRITVGVETRAADLAGARQKTDKKIAAIIRVLKANGVAQEDVQLTHITVTPMYKSYDSLILKGYTVQKNVTFCVKKLDSFENIMALVLQSGANNVSGIQFETNQLEELKISARKKAVQAARMKANYLAEELGLKVGKAVSIRDASPVYNPAESNRVYERKAKADMTGGAFSVGQIKIDAQVEVNFLFANE